MVERTERLTSSWMSSATYDDETQILSIATTAGNSFDHPGVPPEIFDGLITAPSPGAYWHSNIKDVYV